MERSCPRVILGIRPAWRISKETPVQNEARVAFRREGNTGLSWYNGDWAFAAFITTHAIWDKCL